jgi:hypothetical protein
VVAGGGGAIGPELRRQRGQWRVHQQLLPVEVNLLHQEQAQRVAQAQLPGTKLEQAAAGRRPLARANWPCSTGRRRGRC